MNKIIISAAALCSGYLVGKIYIDTGIYGICCLLILFSLSLIVLSDS